MKLRGVGVFVNDMKATVQFYRDVMGMEIEWDGEDPSVIVDDQVVLCYLVEQILGIDKTKLYLSLRNEWDFGVRL